MVDLRALDLRPGEVRRVELDLPQAPLELGGQTYVVDPPSPRAALELQGVRGGVYLKLRFEADVRGPCFRCLEDAAVHVSVDAAEYHEPAGEEEVRSDYVEADELDAGRWARDALVLRAPGQDPVPAGLRRPVPAVRRAPRAGRRAPLRRGGGRPALGEAAELAGAGGIVPRPWPSPRRRRRRHGATSAGPRTRSRRRPSACARSATSRCARITPAGSAATTGAARSSRSARKLPRRSACRRWPSTQWAAIAPRPRWSPGLSRRQAARCACCSSAVLTSSRPSWPGIRRRRRSRSSPRAT